MNWRRLLPCMGSSRLARPIQYRHRERVRVIASPLPRRPPLRHAPAGDDLLLANYRLSGRFRDEHDGGDRGERIRQ